MGTLAAAVPIITTVISGITTAAAVVNAAKTVHDVVDPPDVPQLDPGNRGLSSNTVGSGGYAEGYRNYLNYVSRRMPTIAGLIETNRFSRESPKRKAQHYEKS